MDKSCRKLRNIFLVFCIGQVRSFLSVVPNEWENFFSQNIATGWFIETNKKPRLYERIPKHIHEYKNYT